MEAGEEKLSQKRKVANEAARVAAESTVAQEQEAVRLAQDEDSGPVTVVSKDASTTIDSDTLQTGGSTVYTAETEDTNGNAEEDVIASG